MPSDEQLQKFAELDLMCVKWFNELFEKYFTAMDIDRSQKNWTYNLIYEPNIEVYTGSATVMCRGIFIPKDSHYSIRTNLKEDIWYLDNLNRAEYYEHTGILLSEDNVFATQIQLGPCGIAPRFKLNNIKHLEVLKAIFNHYIETKGTGPTFRYSIRKPTKRQSLIIGKQNLQIIEKRDFIRPDLINEKFYLKSEVDNLLKNIFNIKK